jgi:hypothetical protein
MCTDKIKNLEQQIADLKKQLPAHSIPPGMLVALDELEDKLALAKSKLVNDWEDDA